jgi:hypothetical protein
MKRNYLAEAFEQSQRQAEDRANGTITWIEPNEEQKKLPKQSYVNARPLGDDYSADDIADPRTVGDGGVLKTRSVDDFIIQLKNPYTFWHVVGCKDGSPIPEELSGAYTNQQILKDRIKAYLEKEKANEPKGKEGSST